jgi:hypothetical protein
MARAFTEINRVDEPFMAIFDSEAYRQRISTRKAVNELDLLVLDAELVESNG